MHVVDARNGPAGAGAALEALYDLPGLDGAGIKHLRGIGLGSRFHRQRDFHQVVDLHRLQTRITGEVRQPAVDLGRIDLDVDLVLVRQEPVEADGSGNLLFQRAHADALGLELGFQLGGRRVAALGHAFDGSVHLLVGGLQLVRFGLDSLDDLVDQVLQDLLAPFGLGAVEGNAQRIVELDALRHVVIGDGAIAHDDQNPLRLGEGGKAKRAGKVEGQCRGDKQGTAPAWCLELKHRSNHCLAMNPATRPAQCSWNHRPLPSVADPSVLNSIDNIKARLSFMSRSEV